MIVAILNIVVTETITVEKTGVMIEILIPIIGK